MKSATLQATILAATLLLSGTVGANDSTPSLNQTNGTQVAIAQSAGAGSADDGAHGLSTLSLLALGIIGLLWARRHAGEL
jgi:hypothetical protein